MVAIPTTDNLGNKLVSVAQYAHQYLFQNFRNQGSWIEPGKVGLWRDDEPEMYDHLITVAEETPEMDSNVKQLAAYVADVCNQWGVFCLKEGKNGPVKWEIANPEFRPGEPAGEEALADPVNAIRSGLTTPAAADFGGGSPQAPLGATP